MADRTIRVLLAKLGLDEGTHANRRVLAVLRYLESTGAD